MDSARREGRSSPAWISLTDVSSPIVSEVGIRPRLRLKDSAPNMPGDRAVVLKPGTLVYRVGEYWLWQVYGVENIGLTTGGAVDCTLATS
jgi:hypothetical protein